MAISHVICTADSKGREQVHHGTTAFPIACYENDMSRMNVPWHWHDEMETGIVLEGSVTFASGRTRCILGPGDGFLINAGVLHSCWDEQARCRFQTIVFHPRLVGGGLDSVIYQKYIRPVLDNAGLDWIPLRAGIPWHGQLMGRIMDAWHCCVQEPPGYEIKVRSILSELFLALVQNLPAEQKAPGAKALRDAQRIKHMLQFIHEHCEEDIRLEQVAQSASISESECIRCFHSTIGVTPIQYIRHYRIQKASQLLCDTDNVISLICDQCGFHDVSYFTKTFRESMGCAPAEYRRRQKTCCSR